MEDTDNNWKGTKEGKDGREDPGERRERVATAVDREGQDNTAKRGEPEMEAQGVEGTMIVPDADMEEVHNRKQKQGGEDQGEGQEEPGEAPGGKAPGEGRTGMGNLPTQEGFPPPGTSNQGGDGGARAGTQVHEA